MPYVPTPRLPLLQRDTFTFESALAYDGGEEGLDILQRVLREAPRHLKPTGTLVLELGASQAGDLDAEISALGYRGLHEIVDDEGDLRGIEVFAPSPSGYGPRHAGEDARPQGCVRAAAGGLRRRATSC